MFKPSDTPRIFALPCGTDFPRALVDGLIQRSNDQPPEALAKVELIVNTKRMARRIRSLFDAGPTLLLPRISLLGDISSRVALHGLPPALPRLRRRLLLSQLVAKLLEADPSLAARSSLYDLSDSLAALFDEMQGEGVTTDTIRNLDVSDMSDHWARAQKFIDIADEFTDSQDGTIEVEARQRQMVLNQIDTWQENPPQHPVILAGSTGSRGTTLLLMQAIARLPQGAVVLPGFDFDLPSQVWVGLDDPLISEDHPQFRFHKLMTGLDLAPDDINPWCDNAPPAPARNQLVSLSLRPAPVTDAWMTEGPKLMDLDKATENVTLIEAPNPRGEALAIALRLRQAAEDGQTAALITPDRMLSRRVSATLDRWNILPDDSAGQPLQLSPPGRFLRHVAELFCKELAGDSLLTLLKHPLAHTGNNRGPHKRFLQEMELSLRENGPPFPDKESILSFELSKESEGFVEWRHWVSKLFSDQVTEDNLPLSEWVSRLLILSEAIAGGSQADGSGILWDKKAGEKAHKVMQELEAEAQHGGDMTARDFADLLGALLSQGEVRDRDAPHGKIMIWGTLEARVQGADLVILGGLNEGSWPEAATPDPWLNRQLRNQAGLLLPERRIGLSAHDFQQAIAAPEVWISRAIRSDDSDTVASRWLNRLCNLLDGLPEQNGPDLLQAMRDRGQKWLDWAVALEKPTKTSPALRPSPRPPVSARPRRLTITEIPRLIRDPYAIYAKHVLRLRVLNPLVRVPDALLRGIVVHEVFEHFIKETLDDPSLLTRDHLLQKSRDLLEQHVPWPVARCLWLSRVNRIAGDFIQAEQTRRLTSHPIAFEAKGEARLDPLDFTIACRADRIDEDDRGFLHLYDYKTGAPPSETQQLKFEKQLLIEAAMAEQGAFEDIGPREVSRAMFIGLGTAMKEIRAPIDKDPPAKVWENLRELISAYFEPNQGFSSRRMLHLDTELGDYDHLARFGEWDRSATPEPEDLT
ncbi:double-strand break repair protein AddB [Parasedimentitalea marina]|uniref:Double-strand break repair protein AddB n=2 Tax=Parasedimentitalea marina TaxID=2483033 RepID=A0A3T0N998_9RHOB|nr:double-strand break repair protein AddB [Parasedimentitalea marina]